MRDAGKQSLAGAGKPVNRRAMSQLKWRAGSSVLKCAGWIEKGRSVRTGLSTMAFREGGTEVSIAERIDCRVAGDGWMEDEIARRPSVCRSY